MLVSSTKEGRNFDGRPKVGLFAACTRMGLRIGEGLVELKEAYPIQTAECAVDDKIDHEPAFDWWVPYTLEEGE